MEKKYILALDEGTTSARAILFDRQGRGIHTAQREFAQSYPQPGWVEQDPMEIYAAQYATLTEVIALSGADVREIAALGITNQRETVIVWDKTTGRPLCPAIVWQCRRTADACARMEADGLAPLLREKTGLRPDAYFSASKLSWILRNVDGVRAAAERGDALFGTVDTWLLWKLSGGRLHRTDETNASRTMLYNIRSGAWDAELCRLFDVPMSMLPEVLPSGSRFGEIELLGERIPVCAMIGDQQSALFGQDCRRAGEAKNTYGTGCFLLVHAGASIPQADGGLLTTVAARQASEPMQYALEGSVFVGGAVVQWLRDEMGLIAEARDADYFAAKVAGTDGVYFVPALTGLGAPHWDAYARGMLVGITRGTTKNHIIRAALESIAYRVDDILRAARALGVPLRELRVDGGASRSEILMQRQADLSDVTIFRPATSEATARGAAWLAGLLSGFYTEADIAAAAHEGGTQYSPQLSSEARAEALAGWKRALRCASAYTEGEV